MNISIVFLRDLTFPIYTVKKHRYSLRHTGKAEEIAPLSVPGASLAGWHVSDKEVKEYEQAKEYRAKYRKLLSEVKKQIKFLKGTLRGREPV